MLEKLKRRAKRKFDKINSKVSHRLWIRTVISKILRYELVKTVLGAIMATSWSEFWAEIKRLLKQKTKAEHFNRKPGLKLYGVLYGVVSS